jgi:hypothetical protein
MEIVSEIRRAQHLPTASHASRAHELADLLCSESITDMQKFRAVEMTIGIIKEGGFNELYRFLKSGLEDYSSTGFELEPIDQLVNKLKQVIGSADPDIGYKVKLEYYTNLTQLLIRDLGIDTSLQSQELTEDAKKKLVKYLGASANPNGVTAERDICIKKFGEDYFPLTFIVSGFAPGGRLSGAASGLETDFGVIPTCRCFTKAAYDLEADEEYRYVDLEKVAVHERQHVLNSCWKEGGLIKQHTIDYSLLDELSCICISHDPRMSQPPDKLLERMYNSYLSDFEACHRQFWRELDTSEFSTESEKLREEFLEEQRYSYQGLSRVEKTSALEEIIQHINLFSKSSGNIMPVITDLLVKSETLEEALEKLAALKESLPEFRSVSLPSFVDKRFSEILLERYNEEQERNRGYYDD